MPVLEPNNKDQLGDDNHHYWPAGLTRVSSAITSVLTFIVLCHITVMWVWSVCNGNNNWLVTVSHRSSSRDVIKCWAIAVLHTRIVELLYH